MRACSVVPAAMLLAGCALHRGPAAPEPVRGPVADSLLRFDQGRGELIATKGPLDGIAGLLASDVVYLRAGVPTVYGRDGTRDLLAGPGPSTPVGTSWEPLGGGVSRDLLSGYTFGVTARPSATGAPIRLEKYIAVWRRAPGAPWELAAYAEIDSPAAVEVNLAPRVFTPPLVALPPKLRDATARVRAADSLFSDLSDRMGVGFAFSNTIAPQGVLFTASRMVIGPDATRELYEGRPPGTSLTWRPVFAWVAGSEDIGFTVGEYIATLRGPSGAAIQRFGKYLSVWQRQHDDTWKFVVDGGNGSPPKASDR